MKIKNRMMVILAERDMSIADLARLTGWHYTATHRFCKQTGDFVNLRYMARVCKELEITPADILTYENGNNGS